MRRARTRWVAVALAAVVALCCPGATGEAEAGLRVKQVFATDFVSEDPLSPYLQRPNDLCAGQSVPAPAFNALVTLPAGSVVRKVDYVATENGDAGEVLVQLHVTGYGHPDFAGSRVIAGDEFFPDGLVPVVRTFTFEPFRARSGQRLVLRAIVFKSCLHGARIHYTTP